MDANRLERIGGGVDDTGGARVSACETFRDGKGAWRLAIGVRACVRTFRWSGTRFEHVSSVDTGSERVRSLLWVDATRLLAGVGMDFLLVDTRSRVVSEPITVARYKAPTGLAGMGLGLAARWAPEPFAVSLSDGEILLVREAMNVTCDHDGRLNARKRPVQWRSAPSTVVYCAPYIVAVLADGVEVRDVERRAQVQRLPLTGNAARVTDRSFLIWNASDVWLVAETGLDTQVGSCVHRRG